MGGGGASPHPTTRGRIRSRGACPFAPPTPRTLPPAPTTPHPDTPGAPLPPYLTPHPPDPSPLSRRSSQSPVADSDGASPFPAPPMFSLPPFPDDAATPAALFLDSSHLAPVASAPRTPAPRPSLAEEAYHSAAAEQPAWLVDSPAATADELADGDRLAGSPSSEAIHSPVGVASAVAHAPASELGINSPANSPVAPMPRHYLAAAGGAVASAPHDSAATAGAHDSAATSTIPITQPAPQPLAPGPAGGLPPPTGIPLAGGAKPQWHPAPVTSPATHPAALHELQWRLDRLRPTPRSLQGQFVREGIFTVYKKTPPPTPEHAAPVPRVSTGGGGPFAPASHART